MIYPSEEGRVWVFGNVVGPGGGAGRWDAWRPTVGLFRQEDVVYGGLELFFEEKDRALAERVMADVRQVSPETEVRGHVLGIRDPWDFEQVYEALWGFFDGYGFDPDGAEYLAHITTGTHVCQICLFLLTEARFFPGKLLQTSPPRGRKARVGGRAGEPGVGRAVEIDLDLSKYDRIATRFAKEQVEAVDFLKSGIATRNGAFNAMIERIEQVALRSAEPVLLTGPTGAGKSQLARRVFELRRERAGLAGEFVEVNCATLRGDTAASALFGHVRGSFTGAQRDRPGLLREADGGVLFLDEVGELGADEQAMLLRALEDRTFYPVGSDRPVRSEFQLIAGTNRDLRGDVAVGRFREDLLARMDVWAFRLPGLAERREDIAPNLEYELGRFAEATGRSVTFNREARERFLRFARDGGTPWRGNFRDLNAAVKRMATLAPRGRVRVDEVEEEIGRLEESWRRPGGAGGGDGETGGDVDLAAVFGDERAGAIDPFDAVQLRYVIGVCRRSRTLSEAGRRVFAESRKRKVRANDADRLRKYLAKWGVDFEWLKG